MPEVTAAPGRLSAIHKLKSLFEANIERIKVWPSQVSLVELRARRAKSESAEAKLRRERLEPPESPTPDPVTELHHTQRREVAALILQFRRVDHVRLKETSCGAQLRSHPFRLSAGCRAAPPMLRPMQKKRASL